MGLFAQNLRIGALLSVGALSCSSAAPSAGPATFSSDAYAMATSDSGALHVEVRTSPQPPVRGTNEAELTVTGADDGRPRDGLDVQVTTWMPAMNHGSSAPTVTAEGGGKYLVQGVYLYMPGTWELRMTFAGAITDHATASLSVP
jgi:hypothetical protein